jgi:hypothetical protein
MNKVKSCFTSGIQKERSTNVLTVFMLGYITHVRRLSRKSVSMGLLKKIISKPFILPFDVHTF